MFASLRKISERPLAGVMVQDRVDVSFAAKDIWEATGRRHGPRSCWCLLRCERYLRGHWQASWSKIVLMLASLRKISERPLADVMVQDRVDVSFAAKDIWEATGRRHGPRSCWCLLRCERYLRGHWQASWSKIVLMCASLRKISERSLADVMVQDRVDVCFAAKDIWEATGRRHGPRSCWCLLRCERYLRGHWQTSWSKIVLMFASLRKISKRPLAGVMVQDRVDVCFASKDIWEATDRRHGPRSCWCLLRYEWYLRGHWQASWSKIVLMFASLRKISERSLTDVMVQDRVDVSFAAKDIWEATGRRHGPRSCWCLLRCERYLRGHWQASWSKIVLMFASLRKISERSLTGVMVQDRVDVCFAAKDIWEATGRRHEPRSYWCLLRCERYLRGHWQTSWSKIVLMFASLRKISERPLTGVMVQDRVDVCFAAKDIWEATGRLRGHWQASWSKIVLMFASLRKISERSLAGVMVQDRVDVCFAAKDIWEATGRRHDPRSCWCLLRCERYLRGHWQASWSKIVLMFASLRKISERPLAGVMVQDRVDVCFAAKDIWEATGRRHGPRSCWYLLRCERYLRCHWQASWSKIVLMFASLRKISDRPLAGVMVQDRVDVCFGAKDIWDATGRRHDPRSCWCLLRCERYLRGHWHASWSKNVLMFASLRKISERPLAGVMVQDRDDVCFAAKDIWEATGRRHDPRSCWCLLRCERYLRGHWQASWPKIVLMFASLRKISERPLAGVMIQDRVDVCFAAKDIWEATGRRHGPRSCWCLLRCERYLRGHWQASWSKIVLMFASLRKISERPLAGVMIQDRVDVCFAAKDIWEATGRRHGPRSCWCFLRCERYLRGHWQASWSKIVLMFASLRKISERPLAGVMVQDRVWCLLRCERYLRGHWQASWSKNVLMFASLRKISERPLADVMVQDRVDVSFAAKDIWEATGRRHGPRSCWCLLRCERYLRGPLAGVMVQDRVDVCFAAKDIWEATGRRSWSKNVLMFASLRKISERPLAGRHGPRSWWCLLRCERYLRGHWQASWPKIVLMFASLRKISERPLADVMIQDRVDVCFAAKDIWEATGRRHDPRSCWCLLRYERYLRGHWQASWSKIVLMFPSLRKISERPLADVMIQDRVDVCFAAKDIWEATGRRHDPRSCWCLLRCERYLRGHWQTSWSKIVLMFASLRKISERPLAGVMIQDRVDVCFATKDIWEATGRRHGPRSCWCFLRCERYLRGHWQASWSKIVLMFASLRKISERPLAGVMTQDRVDVCFAAKDIREATGRASWSKIVLMFASLRKISERSLAGVMIQDRVDVCFAAKDIWEATGRRHDPRSCWCLLRCERYLRGHWQASWSKIVLMFTSLRKISERPLAGVMIQDPVDVCFAAKDIWEATGRRHDPRSCWCLLRCERYLRGHWQASWSKIVLMFASLRKISERPLADVMIQDRVDVCFAAKDIWEATGRRHDPRSCWCLLRYERYLRGHWQASWSKIVLMFPSLRKISERPLADVMIQDRVDVCFVAKDIWDAIGNPAVCDVTV